MAWILVPLGVAGEAVTLPQEGRATVGRRPGNTVVCQDGAVSGQHCVLHILRNAAKLEVEDTSTNGTFVNGIKVVKGLRAPAHPGDVLSFTKQPEEGQEPETSPRIQYRLERKDLAASGGAPRQQQGTSAEDGAPGLQGPAPAPSRLATTPRTFAQDLLVQEQENKAKLTADLLASQRKLAEVQQVRESTREELVKVRQQLEQERAQRREAEEGRDRLVAELEALRSDRRQLQELSTSYDELKSRQEASDADLHSNLQRCKELAATVEQLQQGLQDASEAQQKASQHLAEKQTRARQAQERADRAKTQLAETRWQLQRTREELERLRQEREVQIESQRELEELVGKRKAEVAEAEAGEKDSSSKLAEAIARQAELGCKVNGAAAEATAANSAARRAEERLSTAQSILEQLKARGQGLADELRKRAELWEKVLAAGGHQGRALLDAALAGLDGPTVVQVTCRQEDVQQVPHPGLPGDRAPADPSTVPQEGQEVLDKEGHGTLSQSQAPPDTSQQAAAELPPCEVAVGSGAIPGGAKRALGDDEHCEAASTVLGLAAPPGGNHEGLQGLELPGQLPPVATLPGSHAGSIPPWSLEVLDLVESKPKRPRH